MKKKIKGQSSRFRVFYYSHPYLVIFNLLIFYNLILIALAAWLMTFLMRNVEGGLGYTFSAYLKNLEYCTVFTMNTGGIYDKAPDSVVILKIILSVTQMITFTGSLVGLATSMLQGVFDRRAHNVGRLKLKNHYVILNWSSAVPNLIRELSFTPNKKIVVILTPDDIENINEQIDNIFLETGTEKKNITVFVKKGNPSSRKALKEISINKAKSIALLSSSSNNESSDVDTFKLLMSIIGITKKASIVIEAIDEEAVKAMEDLIKAHPDLSDLELSVFSKASVVGHVLARSAINSSYADLYYSMLTYQGGTFFEVPWNKSIKESLNHFSNAIGVSKYETIDGPKLYALATNPKKMGIRLTKKEYLKEIPFKKKLNSNTFSLFVIGKNSRTDSIIDEVNAYKESKQGKIDLKIYPFDFDVEKLLEDINQSKKRNKILILSDDSATNDNIDVNVFMTLLKLKASKKLPSDVEISAELLDQSNKSSLAALNVTNVIISNQMVALYLVQLLTHPNNTQFYETLLSRKTDYKSQELDITVRFVEELVDLKEPIEFNSRLELINSIYEASNHEYIPIGFVGEKEQKDILNQAKDMVGGVLGSVVSITKKTITSITDMSSALNIDEVGGAEVTLNVNSKIMTLSNHLTKKEKIILEKGMIMVLVEYPHE